MSTVIQNPATETAPSRVRPPQAGTSKGQWKVDGRTPLNHTEEFKAEWEGAGDKS